MNSDIELRSDNAAGVAPDIMSAVSAANAGSALAYGADEWTSRLRDTVREVFEHPDADVFPVISGTAANSLALAALCPPWGAVLCHETAHILQSECGATSMFGGGAVMRGVGGEHYRITAATLRQAFDATRWGDPHHSQPSVLSLTVPTDHGTLYTAQQVGELADVAREAASIVESLERFARLPAAARARVRFIHLNHTNRAALSGSDERKRIESAGSHVAVAGERGEL